MKFDTESIRNRWLDAILAGAPDWNPRALEVARHTAAIDKFDAQRAAPHGAVDIIDTWFARSDAAMLKALAECPVGKIRTRATLAVRASFDVFTEHKEHARTAARALLMPASGFRICSIGWRFSDRAWTAMGDTAQGFGHYSKRTILTLVRTATFAYWLRDESEGGCETWRFLDRRIENVMALSKLRRGAPSKR
jgi:ubiquinone biosynthesis protein COQ9